MVESQGPVTSCNDCTHDIHHVLPERSSSCCRASSSLLDGGLPEAARSFDQRNQTRDIAQEPAQPQIQARLPFQSLAL